MLKYLCSIIFRNKGEKSMKKRLMACILTMAVTLCTVACVGTEGINPDRTSGAEEETDESAKESSTGSKFASIAEKLRKAAEENALPSSGNSASDEDEEEQTSSESSDDDALGEFTVGEIAENTYENSYFNVKISLPKNFKFDTSIDTEAVKKSIEEGENEIVVRASSNDGGGFGIEIMKLSKVLADYCSEEDLLPSNTDDLTSEFEKMGFSDITYNNENVDFVGGKHPSLNISGKANGLTFKEQLIYYKKGQYIAAFTVAGVGDDALNILKSATRLTDEDSTEATSEDNDSKNTDASDESTDNSAPSQESANSTAPSGRLTGQINKNVYENSYFNVKLTLPGDMEFEATRVSITINGKEEDEEDISSREKNMAEDQFGLKDAWSLGSRKMIQINIHSRYNSNKEEDILKEIDKNDPTKSLNLGPTVLSEEYDTITFAGETHTSCLKHLSSKTGSGKSEYYERTVGITSGDYFILFSATSPDGDPIELLKNSEKLN